MNTLIEMMNARKEDLLAGKGTTEEVVIAAESALTTSFAPGFRSCLLNYGVFAFDGHEFTGISNNPRLSVVEVTRRQRAINPNIPEDWYVIEEANIDGIVIWQAPDGNIYLSQYDNKPSMFSSGISEYLQLNTK